MRNIKKKLKFYEKKVSVSGKKISAPIPITKLDFGFGQTLAVGLLIGWPLKKYEDGFS